MNEQKTLTIEYNGKVHKSKPFDFEAMCLVDDIRFSHENAGILRLGFAAVPYLFENSPEITQEVLENLPGGEKMRLAKIVAEWYMSDISKHSKNAPSPQS